MAKNKGFMIAGMIFVVVLVCCVSFLYRKTEHKPRIIYKNVSEYTTTGFAQPEKRFSWTVAKEATIAIPLPELQDNYGLAMTVKLFPFLGDGALKQQGVKVFVNNKLLAKWTVKQTDVYTVVLPDDIKNQGDIIKVKFVINNPKSPKELKLSEDTRKLGIAVQALSLTPFNLNNPNKFTAYDIGNEISFARGGGAEKYMASGWSTPEQNFTWTNGKDAIVNLFVNDAKNKKLQLSVSGHAVWEPNDKNQKITVYVNDKELSVWEVGKEYGTFAVKLPESVVQNGALQIRLHINKPIKIGQDPRDLGMAVNTVRISQIFAAQTKNKIATWFKNKVADNSETGQPAENNK